MKPPRSRGFTLFDRTGQANARGFSCRPRVYFASSRLTTQTTPMNPPAPSAAIAAALHSTAKPRRSARAQWRANLSGDRANPARRRSKTASKNSAHASDHSASGSPDSETASTNSTQSCSHSKTRPDRSNPGSVHSGRPSNHSTIILRPATLSFATPVACKYLVKLLLLGLSGRSVP